MQSIASREDIVAQHCESCYKIIVPEKRKKRKKEEIERIRRRLVFEIAKYKPKN
jgi:hypothetical protein